MSSRISRNLHLELFNDPGYEEIVFANFLKDFREEKVDLIYREYQVRSCCDETPQIASEKIAIIRHLADGVKNYKSQNAYETLLAILKNLPFHAPNRTQAESLHLILEALYASARKPDVNFLKEVASAYIYLRSGLNPQNASITDLVGLLANLLSDPAYSESHAAYLNQVEIFLMSQLLKWVPPPPNFIQTCLNANKSPLVVKELILRGAPLPKEDQLVNYLLTLFLENERETLFFVKRLFETDPETAMRLLRQTDDQSEISLFQRIVTEFSNRKEIETLLTTYFSYLTQNEMGILLDQPELRLRQIGIKLVESDPYSDEVCLKCDSMISQGRLFEASQLWKMGAVTSIDTKAPIRLFLKKTLRPAFLDLLKLVFIGNDFFATDLGFLFSYMRNEFVQNNYQLPDHHRDLVRFLGQHSLTPDNARATTSILFAMASHLPLPYRPLVSQIMNHFIYAALQRKEWGFALWLINNCASVIDPQSEGWLISFRDAITNLEDEADLFEYISLISHPLAPTLDVCVGRKKLGDTLLNRVIISGGEEILIEMYPEMVNKWNRHDLFVASCKADLTLFVGYQLKIAEDFEEEPIDYNQWIIFALAFELLDDEQQSIYETDQITAEEIRGYFAPFEDRAVNLALEKLYIEKIPELENSSESLWEAFELAQELELDSLGRALISPLIGALPKFVQVFKNDPRLSDVGQFIKRLFEAQYIDSQEQVLLLREQCAQMKILADFNHSRVNALFSDVRIIDQFRHFLYEHLRFHDFNEQDPAEGAFAYYYNRLPDAIQEASIPLICGYIRDDYINDSYRNALFCTMATLSEPFVESYLKSSSDLDCMLQQNPAWLLEVVTLSGSLALAEKLISEGIIQESDVDFDNLKERSLSKKMSDIYI